MRVPEELWNRIGAEAEKQDRPRTRLVVEMLQRQIGVVERRELSEWDDPDAHREAIKVFAPTKEDFDEALRRGREAFTVENLERQLTPTAKQLQGKTGLPLAACQRHIDKGTWRELL